MLERYNLERLILEKYGNLQNNNINLFPDALCFLRCEVNREFRSLWNKALITENGYHFGNIEETISAVLGHNIQRKTLTKTGKVLVFILTKKHCLDAIIQ